MAITFRIQTHKQQQTTHYNLLPVLIVVVSFDCIFCFAVCERVIRCEGAYVVATDVCILALLSVVHFFLTVFLLDFVFLLLALEDDVFLLQLETISFCCEEVFIFSDSFVVIDFVDEDEGDDGAVVFVVVCFPCLAILAINEQRFCIIRNIWYNCVFDRYIEWFVVDSGDRIRLHLFRHLSEVVKQCDIIVNYCRHRRA